MKAKLQALQKSWRESSVRERLRFNNGKLLVWPKNKDGKELVGVMSMPALALNGLIMAKMAAWWCPGQDTPKTPGIEIVRKEAGVYKKCLLYALFGDVYFSMYRLLVLNNA